MKIEINGQSGDGKVLKVLIQRWLVVCCRVDQNTNPTLAGVCLVQPVTATHALLPGPAAPRAWLSLTVGGYHDTHQTGDDGDPRTRSPQHSGHSSAFDGEDRLCLTMGAG